MTPIAPDDGLPPVLTLSEMSKRSVAAVLRSKTVERPYKVRPRHAILKPAPKFLEKEHTETCKTGKAC